MIQNQVTEERGNAIHNSDSLIKGFYGGKKASAKDKARYSLGCGCTCYCPSDNISQAAGYSTSDYYRSGEFLLIILPPIN